MPPGDIATDVRSDTPQAAPGRTAAEATTATSSAARFAPPGWDRVRETISRNLSNPALAIEPGPQDGETPWGMIWALLAGLLGAGGAAGVVVVRRRLRSLSPTAAPEGTSTGSPALLEWRPTAAGTEEPVRSEPLFAQSGVIAHEFAAEEEPARLEPPFAEPEPAPVLVTAELELGPAELGTVEVPASSDLRLDVAELQAATVAARSTTHRAAEGLPAVASALTEPDVLPQAATGGTSGGDELVLEALTQTSWPVRDDWTSSTVLSGAVVQFGVSPATPGVPRGPLPSNEMTVDGEPVHAAPDRAAGRAMTYSTTARERGIAAAQMQLAREARLAAWSLVALPLLVLVGRSVLDLSFLPRMVTSLGGMLVLVVAAALTGFGWWWTRSLATGGGRLTRRQRRAHARELAEQAEVGAAVEAAAAAAVGTMSLEEALREAETRLNTETARLLLHLVQGSGDPAAAHQEHMQAVEPVARRLMDLATTGRGADEALWKVASELQTARLRHAYARLERVWLRALVPFVAAVLPATVILAATGW